MTDRVSGGPAKRSQLLAAMSALGVSLGMTSAVAADVASPKLGEAHTHKLAAQSSHKVQTTYKEQSTYKEQASGKHFSSIKGQSSLKYQSSHKSALNGESQ